MSSGCRTSGALGHFRVNAAVRVQNAGCASGRFPKSGALIMREERVTSRIKGATAPAMPSFVCNPDRRRGRSAALFQAALFCYTLATESGL
jgi:hypothetical protein